MALSSSFLTFSMDPTCGLVTSIGKMTEVEERMRDSLHICENGNSWPWMFGFSAQIQVFHYSSLPSFPAFQDLSSATSAAISCEISRTCHKSCGISAWNASMYLLVFHTQVLGGIRRLCALSSCH